MISELDANLYKEYKSDPNREEFQNNFIRWYEKGGVSNPVKKENRLLKKQIEALRKEFRLCDLAKMQTQVAEKTLKNLAGESFAVAESTARNIRFELNQNIKQN